jgi:hypothetical protein
MFFLRLRKKDIILLLAFLCSLFSTLSPLFAKGKKDDVFKDADRLIAEKNYDEAISHLVRIARNDPNLFDKVQGRFQNIMRLSNRYTDIATQLLNLIERDPDNTARIFELSEALDTLGEARTEEAQQFILQIQQVARYSVFRNQLENILVNGRLLIDEGDYAGAYNLYLSGFSLYRNVFNASDYQADVKASMNATQDSIVRTEALVSQQAQRIRPLAAEFTALPKESDDSYTQFLAVAQAVDRIRGELNGLIEIQERVYDARDDYRRYSAIENSGEAGYYISFGNLLINGRADQDIQEGLLGVTAALWQSATKPLEEITNNAVDGVLGDIFKSIDIHDYTRIGRLIAETTTALRGARDISTLAGLFSARDDSEAHTVFGRSVKSTEVSFFAVTESLNLILPLLAQGSTYAKNCDIANNEMLASTTIADYQTGRIGAAAAIQKETDIRNSLARLETDIEYLGSMFEARGNEIAVLSPLYDGASHAEAFFRDGLEFARSIGSNLSNIKVASAVRQYSVENDDYASPYSARKTEFDFCQTLSDGVPRRLDNGEIYISKDPFRVAAGLDTLTAALTSDIGRGRTLLARYDAENADIIGTNGLAPLRSQVENQLALYETLYTESTALTAAARRSVAEAEALRNDGAQLYQTAIRTLAQSNPDQADVYLARSGIQYDASLSVQDSDALRIENRGRFQTLEAEIVRVRQELITREVNELIERAQPEFYADNYEAAEQLLLRAQTRYAAISEEENPTVRYWLSIVRNALSLRSGRTIPFTAPLYPEMSQLLSSAGMEYAEGILLLNSRREEALQYFSRARQKAQEVKLLYPLNQEANLLQLRIDQVVDPAVFNATFNQRITAALTGVKMADVQAFADLQDLAEINPNYRGMTQIIYQAEIDMGVRPPPPNEAAIARSRDLTRSAQNLIEGGVRSNLEVAQQQLIEALRVNPDNATAQTQLDRVQRLMGQRATSELEAVVDGDYEEALRELLAGNKLIAYSIVRRVLARPEHRNSGRFQELLQRIESVL